MEDSDMFLKYTEKWVTQFVKQQDEFIKQECINHLMENNKIVRIFKIDENILNEIFDIGLKEYVKRLGD